MINCDYDSNVLNITVRKSKNFIKKIFTFMNAIEKTRLKINQLPILLELFNHLYENIALLNKPGFAKFRSVIKKKLYEFELSGFDSKYHYERLFRTKMPVCR